VCGRFRLSQRKQIIQEQFDVPPDNSDDAEDWVPRYNVAPTQPALVIRQHPKEPRRVLTLMRWGLIPLWSKDTSGAAAKINARSETAATLPVFRDAMKSRRCIVPADGFYEWRRTGGQKQPFCFEVQDGELFAFAGLWERWKNPEGEWVKSFSILTTTPNVVTSTVHDRMPVILDRADYDLWLDPAITNAEAVIDLLKPYPADQMRSYPVGPRVNNVANDDPECSTPVELAPTVQSSLF
jgi:putative SOS response-associated peptidase YedK